MPSWLLRASLVSLLLLTSPLLAQEAPDNWDGLRRVSAKRLDGVYLLPGADFRMYTKVLLDPTEVAFRKNWQRDVNRSTIQGRVSDSQVRRILDEARSRFQKAFAEAYTKAGYQLASEPGSDVLRVSTAVVNLDIDAPDVATAGRSRTYSREAGNATLIFEARDALTNELIGRAVDHSTMGATGPLRRNGLTNSANFERAFANWARISAEGLNELKARSPIEVDGSAPTR